MKSMNKMLCPRWILLLTLLNVNKGTAIRPSSLLFDEAPIATRNLSSVGEVSSTPTPKSEDCDQWTFSWPYSDIGGCECNKATWGEYPSQESCQKAFALSPYEFCTYKGLGVSEYDCDFAVSKVPGVRNSHCYDSCVEYVYNRAHWPIFDSECFFETYHVQRGEIRPEGDCFQRRVFGHSDDSIGVIPDAVVAYKTLPNIYTAASCQDACQADPLCSVWLWRRLPSRSDPSEGSAPYDPYTCLLKSTAQVAAAVNTMLPEEAPPGEDPRWEVCDFRAAPECVELVESGSSEMCLECDCRKTCVWISEVHLSGPKYCGAKENPCDTLIPTENPEGTTTIELGSTTISGGNEPDASTIQIITETKTTTMVDEISTPTQPDISTASTGNQPDFTTIKEITTTTTRSLTATTSTTLPITLTSSQTDEENTSHYVTISIPDVSFSTESEFTTTITLSELFGSSSTEFGDGTVTLTYSLPSSSVDTTRSLSMTTNGEASSITTTDQSFTQSFTDEEGQYCNCTCYPKGTATEFDFTIPWPMTYTATSTETTTTTEKVQPPPPPPI